jgi:hypothetical protein
VPADPEEAREASRKVAAEAQSHDWLHHFAALRANPQRYHPDLPADFNELLKADGGGESGAGATCVFFCVPHAMHAWCNNSCPLTNCWKAQNHEGSVASGSAQACIVHGRVLCQLLSTKDVETLRSAQIVCSQQSVDAVPVACKAITASL